MIIDINNLLDSKCVTVSTENEHKATVTVGKDTIEAEYFTFNRSGWWKTKKMNFFEKVWDVITTPHYRVKRY